MQDAIHHLRRADPVMGAIIERVGAYRIAFREPNFESLAKAIVYQQLSGKVAAVIYGRLSAAVKEGMSRAEVFRQLRARGAPVICGRFWGAVKERMTPEEVLKLRPDRMRRLGHFLVGHPLLH